MKRFLLSLFFVFAFSPFLYTQKTFAQTAASGNVITIEKNQTIEGDYFAGGNSVAIHGTINGDVYVGSGNVQIDGTINGDILAAGGTLLLQGSAHNVRALGGNVTIDGTTDGNITVVGGTIIIADGAKIAGSVVAAGGQISVLGPIGKGLTMAGGQLVVGNEVNGNVLAAGNVTLSPTAKINGTFTYINNKAAQIDNGATVAGKITHNMPPKQEEKQEKAPSQAMALGTFSLFFGLVSFISLFILGLLFLRLFPIFTKKVVEQIISKPWLTMGIGFLTAIAIPVGIGMLFLTIFGIPLALVVLAIYGLLCFIVTIFAGLFLGTWILRKTNVKKMHPIWALFVGLLVVEILRMIPFVGWIAGLVFWWMGLGGLLMAKKDTYMLLRGKKII